MQFPPRTMLVATDLTETSEPALAFARLLHERFRAAARVLHAHHLVLPPYFTHEQSGELRSGLAAAGTAAVDYLRGLCQPLLGFEAEFSVVDGDAVEAIITAAEAPGVDLVIMGTHGRHGADRFWLGSVAERVLRSSPKPVLAVRAGMAPLPFRHVLCPVTDSALSRKALGYAISLTQAASGKLTVIHAVERGASPPDWLMVPAGTSSRCEVEELTYHGDAPGAILTAARERPTDVIVMGGERKTSAFGAFFSSTTERVMQWAQAPVIVVPASA